MSDKCQKCGNENTVEKHRVHFEIPQVSSAATAGSMRTGIWKSGKKMEHRVEIIGEHPIYKDSIIFRWQGREITGLKREVTETTKAPNADLCHSKQPKTA
jgi:hypothetical protein